MKYHDAVRSGHSSRLFSPDHHLLPRARVTYTLLFLLTLAGSFSLGQTTDFQRDVRPILAEHCFQCHGQDDNTREAGLRLDQRQGALSRLESGATAILPGKPAQSALIARITTQDADEIMPPPHSKKPLSERQIQTLKQWIAEGAHYAGHWAFEPPVRPKAPKLAGAGQLAHPLDALVLARLQRDGLRISPPAPPDILCRRLHLDLVGLPPTPAAVAEFVAACRVDRDATIRALVDKLLNSPHYGEKWARHWLDAARYADSNGYEKDLPREQWAWRDWVIQAYNTDLPYDQFLLQQFAGDLLADQGLSNDDNQPVEAAARRQNLIVATGMLRNGMINEEGAIVPEEFRMEGMFDRMDCLGKAVLGLSVQCGQCHTHKFDPVTQNEYYGMFAFLNNSYEAQSWVYSRSELKKIYHVRTGIAAVEEKLRATYPDWTKRLARWEEAENKIQNAIPWQAVEAEDLHSSSELNHPTMLPDKSILTLGHRTVYGDTYMIAAPELTGVQALRLEILEHGDLPFNGPGRSFKGTWTLTELLVEAQPPGSGKWEKLPLVDAIADYSEPEHKLEPEWANASRDKEGKRACGPVAMMVDGKDETAWRADRGPGRRNSPSVAVARFTKPLDLPADTKLKISLRTNHGGDDNGPKNVMVGRFRVSLTKAPGARVNTTPYAAVLAMRTPPLQRSRQQQDAIFTAWRESVPEFKKYNDDIEALWRQYPEARTSILHLSERPTDDIRITHRLERGMWNRPKEAVAPHVPVALHPLSARQGIPPNRLDFARWLGDRRSPLTARVAVNRVWQALFGNGLVETSEDFGTRAPTPVHLPLLDWLSVEFMDRGWSQKELLRRIVTSATYQQQSTVSPELLERDPQNHLLTRGPRFRLEAEVLRDAALSAAGLLHPTVGGPSIFPPVPASVLEYNYFKPTYWNVAQGPERYRRSLYVFRKRSMPDPVLSTLDAPNADFACARRPRSNTPLGALVGLNEPVFVEAARALALRVLKEGGPTDTQRVDYAYQLCAGRGVTPSARAVLLQALSEQRRRLADGWLSAREITTGDPRQLPTLPPGCTPQDAAAWTIVSRVFLNLDETITKD